MFFLVKKFFIFLEYKCPRITVFHRLSKHTVPNFFHRFPDTVILPHTSCLLYLTDALGVQMRYTDTAVSVLLYGTSRAARSVEQHIPQVAGY